MLAAAVLDATITQHQHKHRGQAVLEVAAVAGPGLVMEHQAPQTQAVAAVLAQQILEMALVALVVLV